jgi:deaminated glutathione amidase
LNFKAALIQMRSSREMASNLEDASKLIRQAASQGATFISTPEMTNIFEPDRERLKAVVMTEADDSSVHGLSALATKLEVWLHIGSMALKGDDGKVVNRTLLFNPKGEIVARYDKIHLFDVDLPNGDKYRESETYTAGAEAVKVDLPFCNLGLSICYDVRFPALYHALAKAGANVLVVPAAFTVPTGKAHWHVLLRARAIETGSYVIAAAQGGKHDSGRETFGHSKVVNPWGQVIAEAGSDPEYLLFEVDPAESTAARQRIPALVHAREFSLSQVKA